MSKALNAYIDRHFVRNEFGIWCPNCDEQIDSMWPESCDHCGYPKKGYEDFSERDDLDDIDDADFQDWLDRGRD